MTFHRKTLLATAAAATLGMVAGASAQAVTPSLASGAAGQAPQSVQLAAFDQDVYSIQLHLNRLGYDAGAADGIMGPQTRAAIRAYQRDNAMLPTGTANDLLEQKLEESVSAAFDKPGMQPPDEGDRTLKIQRQLSELGYDVPKTGMLDTATNNAIQAYQRARGLPVTGEPNKALLEALQGDLYAAEGQATGAAQGQGEGGTAPDVVIATDADAVAIVTTDDDPAQASERVKTVQTALNARGYQVGDPDGRLDEETRDAIRAFQRDTGAEVTGRINETLLTDLYIDTRPEFDEPIQQQ